MFEPLLAPRRRPMFAISAAAHAALALALVVPPLLATPAAPELDGFVRIEFVPVLMVDAPAREREDLLRRGREDRPETRSASANNVGARSGETAAPRSALFQPTGAAELLPAPTGEQSELPFEESGERSEPGGGVPGGSDGTGSSSSGHGCEGCPIPADAYGVTPPVALDSPAIAYPELARRAHVEGVVLLEAIIDAYGSVRDVRIIRGAHGLLDPAAVEAVLRWRYRPARIGDRRVAVSLKVVVTFSLRNL